ARPCGFFPGAGILCTTLSVFGSTLKIVTAGGLASQRNPSTNLMPCEPPGVGACPGARPGLPILASTAPGESHIARVLPVFASTFMVFRQVGQGPDAVEAIQSALS